MHDIVLTYRQGKNLWKQIIKATGFSSVPLATSSKQSIGSLLASIRMCTCYLLLPKYINPFPQLLRFRKWSWNWGSNMLELLMNSPPTFKFLKTALFPCSCPEKQKPCSYLLLISSLNGSSIILFTTSIS